MFFVLSFVLPITSAILVFLFHYSKGCPIWVSILAGFVIAIVVFALICVSILFTLHFKGRKFRKTDDPFDPERWKLMNDVSRFSCFWLGIRIKKFGLEKLPKNDNVIFYSNHVHFSDIIIYDLVLKDYPRGSMFKKEYADNPLFGDMAFALGGVCVDRENDRSAVLSVIEIIKRVKSGLNYMIYPEGTRSRNHELGEYHPGSFKVAYKTNKPIAILAIDYEKKIPPSFPFLRTRVYVEVVEVLVYEEYKYMTTVELAEYAQKKARMAIEKARETYKYLRWQK